MIENPGLEKTHAALVKYMEEAPEANQGRIAKAIGMSPTIISQFLAGKYKGNVEAIAAKIAEFLQREAEREQHISLKPKFAMTSQAQEALAVLQYCHVHRMMGVVHAPAGLGKTMSLNQYAKEHSWVMIISCFSGICQKDLLEEILENLGKLPKGNKSRMLRNVIAELEGSETLLVFDEAQHLKLKEFELIRAIHDRTETPIVFSGTDDIIERMTGKRNIWYDQIFSRVGIKRRLKPQIKKQDVGMIMETVGVEHRRDLLDFLFGISQRKGYFRTMMHCLYAALAMAKQKDESLNVGHLQVASQFLWDSAA